MLDLAYSYIDRLGLMGGMLFFVLSRQYLIQNRVCLW